MDREEAIFYIKELQKTYASMDKKVAEAIDMAIEALSAEQKEEELAKDIARRMATIIENEQDMRVILKNASAEDEQGVGRYEKAMQKLRDMPRYLNGVKEKQITKISTNYTTEKPNDIVEQKNDVVAEPTDIISRAELLDRIKAINSIPWGDDHGNAVKLVWSTEEVKRLIEKAPSADRPSGEGLDD